MALGPGARLDVYEIVGPLDAGGMGEVWLARDTNLGRQVAVKLLPVELSGDATRVARFQQEARLASSLNHPNICTIHALGTTPTAVKIPGRSPTDAGAQCATPRILRHSAGIFYLLQRGNEAYPARTEPEHE